MTHGDPLAEGWESPSLICERVIAFQHVNRNRALVDVDCATCDIEMRELRSPMRELLRD
jgi:hypothetical protein